MKKQRIVIASVLKPVDDTRMLEKMGMTLDDSGNYEVFIIGYPTQRPQAHESIRFLPLPAFQRMSFGRFFAPFKIVKKIVQVKPDFLIVATHELLLVAAVVRLLLGTKIIYDIRENYYRNILHTPAFPVILRPLLAGWVRLKESMTSPFFNGFFLAEKGYEKEMRFFNDRAVVIENKAIVPRGFQKKKGGNEIRLLFSGTLAPGTGIFDAIRLAKRLFAADPSVRLKIIGYSAQRKTLEEIESDIARHPFISLIGGHRLVPHPDIMEAVSSSDFGIVAYPPSRHTENSIPTKLYEYLACSLPVLLQKHPPWMALCTPYHASIPIDFKDVNPESLLEQMRSTTFYDLTPQDVTWEAEGPKLLAALANIKNA